MRVLITDDEPLAQVALEKILAQRADVERFDVAKDAVEALDKLSKENYDVLLLDISMPEVSGIELVDRLAKHDRPAPSIIFVTAYEEHAITAFKKHAVDYVLKPFSSERINEALDVAFRRTSAERAARLVEDLPRLQLLLQREGGSCLLRESISVMAEKLKAYGFIRIHRSVLINAAFVEEIKPWPTGEYGLRIKGGKEYTVTRSYKKNLREIATSWIGIDSFIEK